MCGLPEVNDDPNIALGELADLIRRAINLFESKHKLGVTDVTIVRQQIDHKSTAQTVNVAVQASLLRQTFNFNGETHLGRDRS